MNMEKQAIKKIIEVEIQKLQEILGGTPEKLVSIISEFSETPRMMSLLKGKISSNLPDEAAAIIHKVKVRYSYLGFEDVFEKLTDWEQKLKNHQPVPEIEEELESMSVLTDEIIEELLKVGLNMRGNERLNNHNLPLSGKKVLIVEDDEINAMVFDTFICELGGSVLFAQDGFEAINKTMTGTPDLIFIDVHMPFCSGLDAIKAIREKGITIPIISLSASSRLNERNESIHAGANDFITKPVTRQIIQKILHQHLTSSEFQNKN